MQNLKETQEELFDEVKALVQKFSEFSTEEDFVNHINLINELQEKVISLKNYKQINELISVEESMSQNVERQVINFEIDTKKIEDSPEEIILIDNKKEGLENQQEEEIFLEESIVSEKIDEDYFIEKEEQQKELSENIEKEKTAEISEITSAKEEIEKKEEEERLHEERRKIVDISTPHKTIKEKPNHEHPENIVEIKEEIHEERKEHHEKKFKLSNIKGLKATVQSLFDEDPLDKIIEKVKTQEKETLAAATIKEEKPASSLVKSNLPTDYMEAEKTHPDFKLDINDRLAFTKKLFNGSQVELNQVIGKLNSFKTLDEAKSYLSEEYYARNWEKSEEFAQRLWSLVENKFM